MGIIKRIRQAIRKRKASDFGALVAPAYDPLTRRTSTWAHSWNLQDVALYRRGDARHQEALTLITRTQSQANLFFFVGHGSPSGLFTDPQIGKVPSPISNRYHGCLLDTDDLVDSIRDLHVVAWSCDSGRYFGQRVAAIPGSAFLGFNGKVNLVFNDPDSERLWGTAMRLVFERVRMNRGIRQTDKAWLRKFLLELRDKIASGEVNTGHYNRINSMFLKSAARRIC